MKTLILLIPALILSSCGGRSSYSPPVEKQSPEVTKEEGAFNIDEALVFRKGENVNDEDYGRLLDLILKLRKDDLIGKRVSSVIISNKDSQLPDPQKPGKFILTLDSSHSEESLDKMLTTMLVEQRAVVSEDLSFRSSTGDFDDKNLLDVIPGGYEIVLTGKSKENVRPEFRPWVEVFYLGRKGWVYEDYLLPATE